jgi:hypothetical protein
VRVRIGMSMAARELDLEVADAEEVMRSFRQAVEQGDKLLWVVDEEGHRHGLVVDKIAYVDAEPDKATRVGFGNG